MMTHTPTPWDFPVYLASPKMIAEAAAVGINFPRMIHTDGSVNIMAGPEDGDSKVVAHVMCQSDFKRGTGHSADCLERDANAAFIVRAVNSHAALVEALRDLLAVAEQALPIIDAYRRHALGEGDVSAYNIRQLAPRARAALAAAGVSE
jgi:hypothetical protein